MKDTSGKTRMKDHTATTLSEELQINGITSSGSKTEGTTAKLEKKLSPTYALYS